MKAWRRWRPPDGNRVAVLLLGTALVVLTVLVVQSLGALRAHQRVVEATLRDYATFASVSVARELDARFTALFLDQIAVGREAHLAWAAGLPHDVADGRRELPHGGIPFHFTVDGDSLVARGGTADEATRRWVLETVPGHARVVYPAPAPYAVLRSGGPKSEQAIVYRRETYYEDVRVFGFVVDLSAFGAELGRIVRTTPTLPRSLEVLVEPAELLGIRLHLPRGATLLDLALPVASDTVTATTVAAKAGRLAVTATLDRAAAARLVPGGSLPVGMPFFGLMALCTVGLFAAAAALTRRAARLTRMREELVANVSHDLRTPLAQIRMFSETLQLGRLPDPAERDRALEIIRREADRLASLVDNLLHAARRGSRGLAPLSTDLAALVAETVETMRPAADATGSRLLVEVAGEPDAHVDPVAVRRILENLLDNALKHGARDQAVVLRVRHDDGLIRIVVTDQGPGVPRRDRARVWDRFHRLGQAAHVTGAGLGLAVVLDLARRHGGGVSLDEAPGGGARVVVSLATDIAAGEDVRRGD